MGEKQKSNKLQHPRDGVAGLEASQDMLSPTDRGGVTDGSWAQV